MGIYRSVCGGTINHPAQDAAKHGYTTSTSCKYRCTTSIAQSNGKYHPLEALDFKTLYLCCGGKREAFSTSPASQQDLLPEKAFWSGCISSCRWCMKGMKRSSIGRIFIPGVYRTRRLVRNCRPRGRRSMDDIIVRRTRANQKFTRQNSRENGACFLRKKPKG